MTESLRKRSYNALFWAFLQQGGSQLIRFIFSILLARMLSPEDYGLMGLALLVYNFLQIVSRFGLGEGLVQANKLDESRQSALLVLHGGLAVLGSTACWFLAMPVANWYSAPDLAPLIKLLSLSFLFSIGVIIPRSLIEKELRFDLITRRALPATLIAGTSALAAAYAGWGAVSLILLVLVEQLVLAVSFVPWIPRKLPAGFHELKALLSYSWKLSLAGVLGFIGKNVDTALIGKWIGNTELGYYSLGFRLTRLPAQNLAGVLDRVLFPAFSSIKEDKARIASAYGKALKALSWIVVPLFSLGFYMVEPLTPILLGEAWIEAIPVMQVFCLLAMVQTMGRSMNAVIQSLGRSDLVLGWVFLSAPANIVAVWFSADRGIVNVAWALFFTRLLIQVLQLLIVTRLLHVKWHTLLIKQFSGLIVALPIVAYCIVVSQLLPDTALFQLLAQGGILIALLLLVIVLGPGRVWTYLNT
jgi:O-antigen/teichoic acid export membrane protein